MTKGVQYLHEIKEHIISAFQDFTNRGVLCEEILRGVRYNLKDVMIHPDSAHHGPGQIIPCARKAFYACQLASGPKILEPMYLVEIDVPTSIQNKVFTTLNARRSQVIDIQDRPGTPISIIRAHLPVLESFGFTQLLRENTGGKASPQMNFSHWKEMLGDPMLPGTPAHAALIRARTRKGLKVDLPVFTDFYDKYR